MNQRSRNSRDRKRDSFVSMATGSHNTLRRTTGKQEGTVQITKSPGVAKASPSFKVITPAEIPSAAAQKKALAENEVEKTEPKAKTAPKAQAKGGPKKATGDVKDKEKK